MMARIGDVGVAGEDDDAEPCDGAGGRPRHAHAAVQRPCPEAAGRGRRQVADRLRRSTVWPKPASSAPWSTCITSPTRWSGIWPRGKRPQIVISDERAELLGTGGGIAKALPQLGDAPFFLVNSDTVWLDGVKPNFARLAEAFDPDSMDALLLLAPTAGSIGYAGRGDFAMLPDGRLRRRAEREVVPFVYAGAAILTPGVVRRRAGRRVSADAAVRSRRRRRAGCSACASKAFGCMWARRKPSPPPKRRSPRVKRSMRRPAKRGPIVTVEQIRASDYGFPHLAGMTGIAN